LNLFHIPMSIVGERADRLCLQEQKTK